MLSAIVSVMNYYRTILQKEHFSIVPLLFVRKITPATTSPELTELVERAAIEKLVSNYYTQLRSDSKQDFMSFFTTDGRLEVNGWVVSAHL